MVALEAGVPGRIDRVSIHGELTGNVNCNGSTDHTGAPLERGVEVVCSILDVDLVECCLVLTRNPNVQSHPSSSSTDSTPASKTPRKGRRSKPHSVVVEEVGVSPGSSVVGLVEHKTPYYLVLSCSTLAGCRLVYGLMDTVGHKVVCESEIGNECTLSPVKNM